MSLKWFLMQQRTYNDFCRPTFWLPFFRIDVCQLLLKRRRMAKIFVRKKLEKQEIMIEVKEAGKRRISFKMYSP